MRSLSAFAVATALTLVAAPVCASETAPPAPLVEFLSDLLAPEITIDSAEPVFAPPEIGSMLLRFGATGLAEIATATGGTLRSAGLPLPLSWICLLVPDADGEKRLLLASDSMEAGAQPLVGLWMDAAPVEETEREGCTSTPADLAIGVPGLGASLSEIAARFGIAPASLPVLNIVHEAATAEGPALQHLQYRLAGDHVIGLGLSQISL